MNRRGKKWLIIGVISIGIITAIGLNLFDSKNPLDANSEEVKIELSVIHLSGTDLISDTIRFNSLLKSEPETINLLTNNYKTFNTQDTSSIEVWKSFFDQTYAKSTEEEISKVFNNYNEVSKPY